MCCTLVDEQTPKSCRDTDPNSKMYLFNIQAVFGRSLVLQLCPYSVFLCISKISTTQHKEKHIHIRNTNAFLMCIIESKKYPWIINWDTENKATIFSCYADWMQNISVPISVSLCFQFKKVDFTNFFFCWRFRQYTCCCGAATKELLCLLPNTLTRTGEDLNADIKKEKWTDKNKSRLHWPALRTFPKTNVTLNANRSRVFLYVIMFHFFFRRSLYFLTFQVTKVSFFLVLLFLKVIYRCGTSWE